MSELFNLTPMNVQNVRNIESATNTDCLTNFIKDENTAHKVEAALIAGPVTVLGGITVDAIGETLATARGYVIDLAHTPDKSGRNRCKVHVPVLGKSRSVAQVFVMAVLDAAGVGYPKGYEIHHIDGVHENNSLDNLVVVTPAAHKRLHYLMDEVARGYKTEQDYMRIVEEVRVRF